LFKYRQKLKDNKINLKKSIISVTIINILIPIIITAALFKITNMFGSPLKLILSWAPDVGVSLILLPAIIFLGGLIKIIWLVIYKRDIANI